MGESPRIIECVCSDEVAEQRLRNDVAVGSHPAGNRTIELYRKVKVVAEPLTIARLVLDTGVLSVEECVDKAMQYVGRQTEVGK